MGTLRNLSFILAAGLIAFCARKVLLSAGFPSVDHFCAGLGRSDGNAGLLKANAFYEPSDFLSFDSKSKRILLHCTASVWDWDVHSAPAWQTSLEPPSISLTHRDGGQGEQVGEGPRLDVDRVFVGRLKYALVGRVHHDPVHRQQQLRLRAAEVEARLFPERRKIGKASFQFI